MLPSDKLIAFTLVYVLTREIMMFFQVRELTSKIMSRDYNDFVFQNSVTAKAKDDKHGLDIKEDIDFNSREDLGPIDQFGMN